MVTSQQILSAKKCGDIFSSDCKQDVIAEYREIARVYHPDISTDPKANEVMAKVNQLYEEALRLIDAGTWEVSNQIILKDKSGKKYVGRYLKQVPFELGEAYIANSSVTYLFALYDECINLIEDGYTILFKDIGYDDEALHSMLKEIGDKGIGVKILDSD